MRHDSKVSAADNLRLEVKPAASARSVRILDCGHDAELEQTFISARFADRPKSRDDARTSLSAAEATPSAQRQAPHHPPHHASLGEQHQAL
jgi:hypothetical protein